VTHSTKLKKLFSFFLILLGVFALISSPGLGVLVLGGVITNGILGGFSGKVGPVVGGKWKDIDYMRAYVIPANPNSPAQQLVRAKMSALVAFGRKLLTSILQVYWDPFQTSMSGFNAFISRNYSKLQVGNVLNEAAVLSVGTLEATSLLTSTYNTSSYVVQCTWDKTISGNGLGSDKLCMVVYDKTNNRWYFESGVETRNSSTGTITIPAGLTATNIYTYVFFYRGTGSSFTVSNSIGDQNAAAPE